MKKLKAGGGWQAIAYTFQKSREVGGLRKMWKAMRSKNACKTCALGMGGQSGGMVNELGSFPEVCKKSLQAMAADMQPAIPTEFWDAYSVDSLKLLSPKELESRGRLVDPLICQNGKYKPTTWADALGRIASKLRELSPEETFWYFSGRSSNEAGFLLQLFARLYGTNNVNNCSYYCHQASGVGLTSSIGSGTATVVLDDVEQADLVFLIGGNPASNHPRLMTSLKNVRRGGGKVIVINPVRETGLIKFKVPSDPISLIFGTKIATQYVQPHIGGDLALLTGIAKRIVELNAHDSNFLKQYCVESKDWLSNLHQISWTEIESKSGVTKREIEQIAETYAKANNVIFSWTMGITHHAHGVENVQAIANLALMRGMVGRHNAGLMPIRGHSNVQGIGSVGVTPKLKDAIFENLENRYGLQLPTTAGMDTLSCMEAANEGKLKLGFCLGGNLYGSNPDSAFAASALNKLDMVVYLSTTLNTGHAFGTGKETIVLPVLARDEEPEATTQESMFNFVRYSEGGPRRHTGPISEVQVVADIASQVLDESPIDWLSMKQTATIRKMISEVVPGWKKIADIDASKQEFQIAGRTFHEPKFATPTQKAILHSHTLPTLKGSGENSFRLMTVRSEGQFNTVVYEDYDLYRGQDRRDVILLHPDDMARLNLNNDQLVIVKSDVGELRDVRSRAFPEIRQGNVLMYFPEANVLVNRRADPKSKTPAFKGVIVSIHA